MRTYTVAEQRSDQNEIDVDFMVHSSNGEQVDGIAAPRAANAKAEDGISLMRPGPAKFIQLDADCYLLAADMTVLPALTANLKTLPDDALGQVFIDSKANTASNNIEEAVLSEYVEIRVGDAMKTLSNYDKPIDFLFLDGWKDLYLPLFKMLEPKFHAKTIIYADNMDMSDAKDYADFIENNNVYKNEVIHNGKAFLTKL